MDRKRKLGDKRKKKPEIHAYVATPAYDGKVDTDYAVSLAESCQLATANEIGVTAAVMGNGAFIDLARNTFAQFFLDETDCTHLFFIDADLRWEARCLVGLLTSGRPVSAGVYRRRQEPEDYPVRYKESPQGGLDIVEGGWIACDRVPTGFLCIERAVVEDMAKDARILKLSGQPPTPELFYTQVLEDGRFMGEDYSWCDDYVSRYEEPIWVWADADFTHGGYECNWHKFLNKRAMEFEEAESKKLGKKRAKHADQG